MITYSDEGPEFEPDDPLAVILRPPSDRLGPPPGHFETIRRAAGRRRLLRAAAGVGVTCAVAALVALPLRFATDESSTSPSVPLAPPPASGPASPTPVPSPSASSGTPAPTASDDADDPAPSVTPTPSADASKRAPTSATPGETDKR
ncbi:hypothetical protein SGFS_015790 [Streptomyces graminofaciens]|uniref:Uncharacterized protein n=1 Tax=Streptomyces graminofaciens TaxID=68212 RepID=A0ABM7F3C7_9ACTN|nr:hypothetical protein [Streptomyces graminofaciens]BBC30285.1 hypothetical protein SGFS_015790 [Streptomyces graminofaciens]